MSLLPALMTRLQQATALGACLAVRLTPASALLCCSQRVTVCPYKYRRSHAEAPVKLPPRPLSRLPHPPSSSSTSPHFSSPSPNTGSREPRTRAISPVALTVILPRARTRVRPNHACAAGSRAPLPSNGARSRCDASREPGSCARILIDLVPRRCASPRSTPSETPIWPGLVSLAGGPQLAFPRRTSSKLDSSETRSVALRRPLPFRFPMSPCCIERGSMGGEGRRGFGQVRFLTACGLHAAPAARHFKRDACLERPCGGLGPWQTDRSGPARCCMRPVSGLFACPPRTLPPVLGSTSLRFPSRHLAVVSHARVAWVGPPLRIVSPLLSSP